MEDLSKKIIQKIDQENIQPYSKWHFLFKSSIIWLLFMVSILLGSFSAGVMIYQFQHTEWDIFSHYNHSLLEFLMLVIPYFWLVFLILFSILVFYYFRRTGTGYRKNTIRVIVGSLLLSLVGGIAINRLNLSEQVEYSFEKNVPFYRSLIQRKRKMWNAPHRGLLAGKIIKTNNDILIVKDFNFRIWNIDISTARVKGRIKLNTGDKIKIIGKMNDSGSFKAYEIRPWMGRGRRRFNPPRW
jgi:hypothetical protein